MARDRSWTSVVITAAAGWALLTAATITTYAARQAQATQPPMTVAVGPLYTAAQAERGERLVKEQCVICHREDLQSGEVDMGLKGPRFLERWGAIPLGWMINLIQTTMPEGPTNRLTVQQATDIVAFILWQNYFPVGEKELPADIPALNHVTLQSAQDHLDIFIAMTRK